MTKQFNGIPDGYALVPMLLTDEMAEAMDPNHKVSLGKLRDMWMRAVSAAPPAPAADEPTNIDCAEWFNDLAIRFDNLGAERSAERSRDFAKRLRAQQQGG